MYFDMNKLSKFKQPEKIKISSSVYEFLLRQSSSYSQLYINHNHYFDELISVYSEEGLGFKRENSVNFRVTSNLTVLVDGTIMEQIKNENLAISNAMDNVHFYLTSKILFQSSIELYEI